MKCEVDKVDEKGCSALWIAALYGQAEAVASLLKNGADKDKAHNDRSPVYIAAQMGFLEVIKVLEVEGADMDKTTSTYSSLSALPLRMAICPWSSICWIAVTST